MLLVGVVVSSAGLFLNLRIEEVHKKHPSHYSWGSSMMTLKESMMSDLFLVVGFIGLGLALTAIILSLIDYLAEGKKLRAWLITLIGSPMFLMMGIYLYPQKPLDHFGQQRLSIAFIILGIIILGIMLLVLLYKRIQVPSKTLTFTPMREDGPLSRGFNDRWNYIVNGGLSPRNPYKKGTSEHRCWYESFSGSV